MNSHAGSQAIGCGVGADTNILHAVVRNLARIANKAETRTIRQGIGKILFTGSQNRNDCGGGCSMREFQSNGAMQSIGDLYRRYGTRTGAHRQRYSAKVSNSQAVYETSALSMHKLASRHIPWTRSLSHKERKFIAIFASAARLSLPVSIR